MRVQPHQCLYVSREKERGMYVRKRGMHVHMYSGYCTENVVYRGCYRGYFGVSEL